MDKMELQAKLTECLAPYAERWAKAVERVSEVLDVKPGVFPAVEAEGLVQCEWILDDRGTATLVVESLDQVSMVVDFEDVESERWFSLEEPGDFDLIEFVEGATRL